VAIIVFLAIPGPGNLALLTATGKGGVRAGLAATLGVIAGDQVLLWLAVASLSAVLINYPSLYSTVQWVGAAYLMGLGYSLYKVKEGDAPVLNMKPEHYFRQALFITVLNPKAIVFYMAFFPLFVDPAIHMGLLTFAVMAATIAALTFGGPADALPGRPLACSSLDGAAVGEGGGGFPGRIRPETGAGQVTGE